MRKFKSNTFYCFSPLVMALTFIIEVSLAFYSLLRYKRTPAVMLGVLILLALATFQLAEYGICENLGLTDNLWAQIGFVSITLLPVLGMHLIYLLAGKFNKYVIGFAYLGGLVWSIMFIFGSIMENAVCNGNYVIFNLQSGFGGAYFLFYYFWLVFGSFRALALAKKAKPKQARALRATVVGYASFTVPATYIWFIYDGAAHGLPSIMCGFALIFALILGLFILPNSKSALPKKKK